MPSQSGTGQRFERCAERSATLQSTQRLYARIWRWHFFTALIVIPFVLWESVTGVLYQWNRELARMTHAQLLHVDPVARSKTYEHQLASALRHQPRERLQAIEITDDPARSTAFFFRDGNGLPYPAFVNPHNGEYLGEIVSLQWLRGLSRGLHGGWPEPYGSLLLELGTSWAIVMVLTGLYLWWPRNAKGLGGVLYPRLGNGPRVFWRDLHATLGIYFALTILAFLFTALPLTTFWASHVLVRIEHAVGQDSPTMFFYASGSTEGRLPGTLLSLDDVVARARTAGLRGTIELLPRFDGAPINLRDRHPRASQEVWVQIDARTGAVLARAAWADLPPISKLAGVGFDLHEGTFFGRANQVFNTLVCLALVWLSVTGFIGWYKRRPGGGLAAPPRPSLRYPRTLLATGVVLCALLPLLAASILIILIADRGLGRFLPARA